MLDKIASFLGGNLFKEIKDTVVQYLPPEVSPIEKAKFELRIKEMLHEKELKAGELLQQATAQLDKRIAEQEGTAGDLKSIPILGPIMLFLRGCQRPAWSMFTMYLDFVWFTGGGQWDDQQNTAMIVVNLLVLGFLFGERTVKNLEPLIIKVFANGKG